MDALALFRECLGDGAALLEIEQRGPRRYVGRIWEIEFAMRAIHRDATYKTGVVYEDERQLPRRIREAASDALRHRSDWEPLIAETSPSR